MHNILRFAGVALGLAALCNAQTSSQCDPLYMTTCPADTALGTSASFDWNTTTADSSVWNATNGAVDYTTNGAEFTIVNKGEAPTIQSLFYIFWGRISVLMKAAPGAGIVSSVVLLSDDLDEIDWEFIGGNTTHVQTTWYGKGDTSTYDRAEWLPVDNTLALHNYTVVWTQEVMEWHIDGALARSIAWDNPLAQSIFSNSTPGDRYPQTPMTIKLGNWAGGDSSSNGTSEWAGGPVDYSKGPFTQTIQLLEVEDYSQGSKYTYGNDSGKWESIQVTAGNSSIADTINKVSGINGIENRWAGLSTAMKIGIAGGALGVTAIAFMTVAFCCVRQRRKGRKERANADVAWDKQQLEMDRYNQDIGAQKELHPRTAFF